MTAFTDDPRFKNMIAFLDDWGAPWEIDEKHPGFVFIGDKYVYELEWEAHWGVFPDVEGVPIPVQRRHLPPMVLLVERNTYDGEDYFTIHDSLEEAGDYHASSEYPNDYEIKVAVDLVTGKQYEALERRTYDWEEK